MADELMLEYRFKECKGYTNWIIESHIADEKEYVDEVAVIKAISDDKEAMREFIKCKS